MTAIDYDRELLAAQPRIKAAIPKGWYALGTLYLDRRLDNYEPQLTYEFGVQFGTDIEGGRTVYYSGKTRTQKSGRRIEIKLRASSVDELIVALKTLPTRGLERLTSLPWPIEFSIESVLLP